MLADLFGLVLLVCEDDVPSQRREVNQDMRHGRPEDHPRVDRYPSKQESKESRLRHKRDSAASPRRRKD